MSHHRDWPVVKRGDDNENVRTVQFLLNHRGCDIAVDGVFGPQTEAEVRALQGRQGLTVDGQVGNQTWPALIVEVTLGSEGDAVRAVQGQFGLTLDGIFGAKTDQAVREFQDTFGLEVDGIVGPETWWGIVTPKSE
jgi:peptidoglycan hydrolase-like protein with peptidoglycan-binding domain